MPTPRNPAYQYKFRIHQEKQDQIWWHDTILKITEVFGPPGKRYEYYSTERFLDLYFRNKKDLAICKMLLSEKL